MLAPALNFQGICFFCELSLLTIDKSIVAIDATTCRERWTYNWTGKGAVLSPTNRGVALKDGRVVRGTADGYLIAVDMANGTLPIADAPVPPRPVSTA